MSAYERGRAAGYAAAVDREHSGDATGTKDGPTWFAVPPGEDGPAAEYERGWLAGWADYFDGRENSGRP